MNLLQQRAKSYEWFLLTGVLYVIWLLLFFEYGPSPRNGLMTLWFREVVILFSLPVAILLCYSVNNNMQIGKATHQAIFLGILIASGALLGGTYGKLYESMKLLADSKIDMSHCTMIFHIRNTGLTTVDIQKVSVGNITFTLRASRYYHRSLPRGTSGHLMIYYGAGTWELISSEEEYQGPRPELYPWRAVADKRVTPITFQNRSKYPVTFHTLGPLKHNFLVEAELTSTENLVISARSHLHETEDPQIDFLLFFNNTETVRGYVYSTQIGNVTLQFSPPLPVLPSSSYWYNKYRELDVIVHETSPLHYYFYGLPTWDGKITATPEPRTSMFTLNKTYEITAWTMTNNHYTLNVTVVE